MPSLLLELSQGYCMALRAQHSRLLRGRELTSGTSSLKLIFWEKYARIFFVQRWLELIIYHLQHWVFLSIAVQKTWQKKPVEPLTFHVHNLQLSILNKLPVLAGFRGRYMQTDFKAITVAAKAELMNLVGKDSIKQGHSQDWCYDTLRFNLKGTKWWKYRRLSKICCYSSLLSPWEWVWKLHPISFFFFQWVWIYIGSISLLALFKWFTTSRTSDPAFQRQLLEEYKSCPSTISCSWWQFPFHNWGSTLKELRSMVLISIRTDPLLALFHKEKMYLADYLPMLKVEGW